MFRKTALMMIYTLLAIHGMAQNRSVRFEDIKDLHRKEPRPVVVLIMTDWCKFCHSMKNTMLNHNDVSSLLSAQFRTVFLNAEEKKDITFDGRTFRYQDGINQLAKELATVNEGVSYPTMCVLNSKNEIIYQHSGYMTPSVIFYLLKTIRKSDDNELAR